MGYPEQLLASDEKVVKHLHPHWITLVVPVFVLLVVAGAAGVGVAVVPDGDAQRWLRLVILVLAVVILVVFTFVPILRWATTHYVITSHRVMFRTGVLNRAGKDIAYPRITDVAYRQSLWDRIVNAGTLTVESAGEGPPQVLDNVPHSDEIQQLINRLVEEDQDRRARNAGRHYGQGYGGPQGGPAPGQPGPGQPGPGQPGSAAGPAYGGPVDLSREPTARYVPPGDGS